LETITKTTAMMIAAGLLISAPACGEQFTTSTTVREPSAPLATRGGTAPTLGCTRRAPDVVQRRADEGVERWYPPRAVQKTPTAIEVKVL
jgi:hypothetical protein